MAIQAPLNTGPLWLGEAVMVAVAMETNAGVELTGLASGDIVVKYADANDVALATLNMNISEWHDLGRGLYHMLLPASILSLEGCFVYLVETSASGNKVFRGLGYVDQRPEDRVLNDLVTDHVVSGSIGEALKISRDHYEVYCGASYDSASQTMNIQCFLHKQGQLVTAPTNCEVKIKESGLTTVVDALSSSPNVDGIFSLSVTTLVLNTKKNFAVTAFVTYGGVTYESGEVFQTFN